MPMYNVLKLYNDYYDLYHGKPNRSTALTDENEEPWVFRGVSINHWNIA